MRKQLVKKIGRYLCTTGFGLILIAGNGLQAFAAEVAPITKPKINPWSIHTLNEGERYGIYPLAWYYDGTFQKPLTADKFKALLDATDAKLDSLGFKQKSVSELKPEHGMTREYFINALYQLLTSYELPQTFQLNTNNSIEYMTKAKLIQGTNSGLELDKPITVEQAAVIASRAVEYVYDKAESGANGLLWKVTNGSNTLYLLGSIHLGISEMYPMEKHIRDAFDASEELWVEANIAAPVPAEASEILTYKDGTTIKDHVSTETYNKLQQVLTKLGIPIQAFDTYKASFVANSLSGFGFFHSNEEQSFAGNAGIDKYFLTKAILDKKPIHELEGLAFQFNLLYNDPDQVQEKGLSEVLEAILAGKEAQEEATLIREKQMDWVRGDLQGYSEVNSKFQEADTSGMTEKLIGTRDQNMAKKMEELLERDGKHTTFVVVGSDHYATKGMVVDLLKEKGYHVEFVQ